MNKKVVKTAYKRYLKEEALAGRDVVLTAGGALVMYGLRTDTIDLEVDIPQFAFVRYSTAYPERYRTYPTGPILVKGQVDVRARQYPNADVRCIEGVWVPEPSVLLGQKVRLYTWPDRPVWKLKQDMDDIQAIIKLMRKEGL